MGKAELQGWLAERSFFKRDVRNVVATSVLKQFKQVEPVEDYKRIEHDWNHLLLCASLLAQSNNEAHQDTSLRIAQHCLNDGSSRGQHKDAAAVILDCLGNRIAIELAESRNIIPAGIDERLPPPLRMDWTARAMEYSLALNTDKILHLNKFQRSFWDAINESDWLSLSAPTSAGKSFIMSNWISHYAREHLESTIVYLVPTRALVQQVEEDLRRCFEEANLTLSIHVSSVPLHSSIRPGVANVLVFTQERLHLLLASTNYEMQITSLIVDEAQKLGDGYRGILLQSVIETSLAANPGMKLIFAAPMADNIESLIEQDQLQDEPQRKTRAISNDAPMVNQNLLWVSHVPGRPKEWNMDLILEGEPTAIGRFVMRFAPTSTSKRLTFVASALGGNEGGNLIYVNGAAEAEKIAKQLYGILPPLSPQQQLEVAGLIQLSRTVVHQEYLLGTVASRGIAFHYGNMPLLLKSEIERLFRANIIKYLICTSTLLEGVNLPCRNVFVRGPRKGRNTPMKDADFWNLAGRAGRWGQEFQGNIVCIDPHDSKVWRLPAPRIRHKYTIQRTSDEVLRHPTDLIEFIENGTPRTTAMQRPDLEYSFSYLVSTQLRFGSIYNTPWTHKLPNGNIQDLQTMIENICSNLNLPASIATRNPGISPLAMENLLAYFREEELDPQKFVPIPSESDQAVLQYTMLLSRINKTLGPVFGHAGRTYVLGLLITNWLEGHPLARLISERINYLRRMDRPANIAKVIRDTMADVEQVARFEAPKYIGCYVDVLSFHLKSIHREDLIEPIKDIALRLEYGINSTTQLSLISLGLSRTTAVALAEIIPNDELTEFECVSWLRDNRQLYNDLSPVIKAEIETSLHQNPESF
ncbi:MAG: DEAD/DEAH box helicase [Nitrospira sp.]